MRDEFVICCYIEGDMSDARIKRECMGRVWLEPVPQRKRKGKNGERKRKKERKKERKKKNSERWEVEERLMKHRCGEAPTP